HLDLAAGGAVEIGGLVTRADFELFDAFHRRWNNARGYPARRPGASVPVTRDVGVVGTGHVVAVVAAVQLVHVLIGRRARDVARRRYTDLQHRQYGRVTRQIRQVRQHIGGNGGSDGRVH